MNHPDQKTIELFALDSPETSQDREELAKHLSECEGCRLQYEEMREFYRALHVVEPPDGTVQEEARPRLLAQPGFMVSRSVKTSERKGVVLAMWRSVREHPRISVGVLAAAIAMTSFLVCNKYKPIATSAHLNIYRQRLEVFDQKNKLMWEVPAKADSAIVYEEDEHHFRYVLSDLSDVGAPELVTTLDFPGDDPAYRHTLRVVRNSEEVHWSSKPAIERFMYRGTVYDEWYGHAYFLVMRNAARKPVIVSAWNGTRSPAAEVVYDSKGNKTGEYWHFGQLQPADTCDIDGDGIGELVTIGTNQSSDDNMGFAVAVFLKPDKIVGRSHSILTPGFDMPTSDAEVAYLRFPLPDMNRALHWGAGTKQLARSGELLHFTVSSGVNDGVSRGGFTFEYFLDRHLHPLSVKWDENARAYHSDLLSRGLIHSRFYSTYMENLRRSVQFWNGSAWQSEPCLIRH
jgi:hypothetical protein